MSVNDYYPHIKKIQNECICIIQDYDRILKLINKSIELEEVFDGMIIAYDRIIYFSPLTGCIIRETHNRDNMDTLRDFTDAFMHMEYDVRKIIEKLNKQDLLTIINHKEEIKTLSLKMILNQVDVSSDESILEGIENLSESFKEHQKYISEYKSILIGFISERK